MAMSRDGAGTSLMRLPSSRRSPYVINSSPASILKVDDLPQPDGPSRQRNAPSATVRSRSMTARVPSGYVLFTLRNSTRGIASPDRAEGEPADEMALQNEREDHYR